MDNRTAEADQVIGHIHATVEETQTILELITNTYFATRTPTEEDLLKIRVEWQTISTLLEASLELLQVAEAENERWQRLPME